MFGSLYAVRETLEVLVSLFVGNVCVSDGSM